MKHFVFIRSYHRDLDWLKYALRSFEKFVTGFNGLVVVVPGEEVAFFEAAGIRCTPCTDPKGMRGYVAQQLCKLKADTFMPQGEDCWITFFDSDCIFTGPLTPGDLFRDGKPLFLHTPFAVLGDTTPWKAPTEAALGFECTEETMRAHGATYRASELVDFRQWFRDNRGVTIEDYFRSPEGEKVSEFNLLGNWLWKCHHGSRRWFRTDAEEFPRLPVRQFWSYSGVEPVRAELEEIVK